MSVYHGAAGNVRENKNKAVVLSLFSLLPTHRCCPTHARNDSLADTQNNRTRKASRASPKRTTPSIPLIGRKSNDSLQWGAAAALCSRKLRTWAEGRQMGHRSDLLLERAQISASPVFLAGRCASCVPAFFRAVRRAHRAYTPSGWPPMDLNGSKLRVWVRSGVPRVGHLAPWPHMVLDPPPAAPAFGNGSPTSKFVMANFVGLPPLSPYQTTIVRLQPITLMRPWTLLSTIPLPLPRRAAWRGACDARRPALFLRVSWPSARSPQHVVALARGGSARGSAGLYSYAAMCCVGGRLCGRPKCPNATDPHT